MRSNTYLYLCIFAQPGSAWSMFSVSLPAFCTFPFANRLCHCWGPWMSASWWTFYNQWLPRSKFCIEEVFPNYWKSWFSPWHVSLPEGTTFTVSQTTHQWSWMVNTIPTRLPNDFHPWVTWQFIANHAALESLKGWFYHDWSCSKNGELHRNHSLRNYKHTKLGPDHFVGERVSMFYQSEIYLLERVTGHWPFFSTSTAITRPVEWNCVFLSIGVVVDANPSLEYLLLKGQCMYRVNADM